MTIVIAALVHHPEQFRCVGEILPVVRSGREKVQFMKELYSLVCFSLWL